MVNKKNSKVNFLDDFLNRVYPNGFDFNDVYNKKTLNGIFHLQAPKTFFEQKNNSLITPIFNNDVNNFNNGDYLINDSVALYKNSHIIPGIFDKDEIFGEKYFVNEQNVNNARKNIEKNSEKLSNVIEAFSHLSTINKINSGDSVAENDNEYFDDDEEFLSGEDRTIHDSDVLSMFQQNDNVVSIELKNLYNNDGKLRNSLVLKDDPAVMEIRSSEGNFAQFVLTKEFAYGLYQKSEQAYKAYYGIEPKSVKERRNKDKEKLTMKDRWHNSLEWMDENKGKSVAFLLLIIVIIWAIVISAT